MTMVFDVETTEEQKVAQKEVKQLIKDAIVLVSEAKDKESFNSSKERSLDGALRALVEAEKDYSWN